MADLQTTIAFLEAQLAGLDGLDQAPAVTTADIAARANPSMMPERAMRRLTAKLRAGLPLSADEEAAMASHATRQREVSDRAAGAGVTGLAELSGVPSMMRGAERIGRGATEGDPWQAAGGVAEAALGAVPAGLAFRPVRQALMTGVGGAGIIGGVGAVGEAQAQDQIKAQRAAGNERAGSGFFTQLWDTLGGAAAKPMDRDAFMRSREITAPRSEAEFVAQAQARVVEDERFKRAGPAGRRRLMDEAASEARRLYQADKSSYDDRVKAAEGEFGKYLEDQARLVNTPFKERAPDVAARLPIIGLAASAALPGAISAVRNTTSWLGSTTPSRIKRLTRQVEEAVQSPAGGMTATLRGNQLAQAVNAYDSPVNYFSRVASPAATIGAGAMVGAEANMLPYQIDANMLPDYLPRADGTLERNPRQQKAQEDALSWSNWLTKGMMNLPTALTGYKIGALVPANTPDMARARGAVETFRNPIPFSPPAVPAMPGAGGAPPPVGGAAGGAGPAPGPPPGTGLGPSAGQTAAAYDRGGSHGQAARQVLDELLASNQGSRNSLLNNPNLVDDIARQIEARIHLSRLPPVDPRQLRDLATETVRALRQADALARSTGAGTATAPALRSNVLNMIQGNPGMLSLPIAAGLGGGAYNVFAANTPVPAYSFD